MARIFNRDRLGRFVRSAWSSGVSFMKKIVLLGAAPIDGEMRYPSEGEIDVAPAIADDLIKVGLAKSAGLSKLTLDELRDVARDELVEVAPEATKPELIEAITNARAAAATPTDLA